MDLINYWTVDMHMLALQLHLSLFCTVHALSPKSEVARELGAMSCGLGWGNVRLDSVKGMSNAEVK